MANISGQQTPETRIRPRPAGRRPPRTDFLPFCRPLITDDEILAVTDTLRSGWITTGPKTKQFEREFATYMGVAEALALNSCTAGLHLALKVLDIGPGDQVITTPLTFCSSANVIEHVGAETVLVDVEAHSMNLDPGLIEQAITPATRAVIAVHLAGFPVNMRDLMDIARHHDLFVIEDAAHAIAARFRGELVGTLGDMASFSFYATKNLTTAEGGMLLGAPALLEKARILSLHGMSRDAWKRYSNEGAWWYDVIAPGYKYNMTDIQACLGLVQLERLATMQARRQEIVDLYNAAFSRFSEFELPLRSVDAQSAWHLYILRLNLDKLRLDRAGFIKQLAARNIGTSVHFIPIHVHPYYREKYGWHNYSFPTAYHQFQRMISLPLYPAMSDDDVADVIAAVESVVDKYRCVNAYSTSPPAQD